MQSTFMQLSQQPAMEAPFREFDIFLFRHPVTLLM